MRFSERENTGVLSRNDQKDAENPAHKNWADFQGDCLIDGKRYWVSAWVKQSQKESRRKFFSLAFKEFTPKSQ